jgi:hypothetical protein
MHNSFYLSILLTLPSGYLHDSTYSTELMKCTNVLSFHELSPPPFISYIYENLCK